LAYYFKVVLKPPALSVAIFWSVLSTTLTDKYKRI
jgi:hypothetical protein